MEKIDLVNTTVSEVTISHNTHEAVLRDELVYELSRLLTVNEIITVDISSTTLLASERLDVVFRGDIICSVTKTNYIKNDISMYGLEIRFMTLINFDMSEFTVGMNILKSFVSYLNITKTPFIISGLEVNMNISVGPEKLLFVPLEEERPGANNSCTWINRKDKVEVNEQFLEILTDTETNILKNQAWYQKFDMQKSDSGSFPITRFTVRLNRKWFVENILEFKTLYKTLTDYAVIAIGTDIVRTGVSKVIDDTNYRGAKNEIINNLLDSDENIRLRFKMEPIGDFLRMVETIMPISKNEYSIMNRDKHLEAVSEKCRKNIVG